MSDYNLEDAHNELIDLFRDAVSPLKICVLFSPHEHANFTCIFSNDPGHSINTRYSIYDIPPLTRVLALKSEILSDSLLEKIYHDSLDKLCVILEWNESSRKVVVFDLENLNLFNEEIFIDTLNTKQELDNIFQKIFYYHLSPYAEV